MNQMKWIVPVLLSVGCWGSQAASRKPNVLFIAVDDLKPMLGCFGDKDVKSPNIDKLASNGMVFLNASCQQAVCGPSRASLMTGCYPDTTKVYDLKTRMRDKNPDIITIPQWFKEHGYETAGSGKIYDPRCVDKKLDEPSWSEPFREYPKEFLKSVEGYSLKGFYLDPEAAKQTAELNALLKKEGATRRKSDPKFIKAFAQFPQAHPVTECLPVDVPDEAYPDGAIAASAIEQMGRLAKGKKPFFLAVGFKKPHLPFVAPKKYWDLFDRDSIKLAPFQKMPEGAPSYAIQDCWELRGSYSDFPLKGLADEDLQRRMIHGYRACVAYTDTQIGKVLAELKKLGLERDTIVVLWGDHGWHLGDHGMFGKHTNYEQAVRAPLIFMVPGQPTAGAKTMTPVEFVDIFPTLCDLARLPKPKQLEGTSLFPVLADAKAEVRKAGLEQFPRGNNKMGYTLRDKRYRYVKWVQMDYYGDERTGPTVAAELYDYEKDPLETRNLAHDPEYKEVVAKFERLFKERNVGQEK